MLSVVAVLVPVCCRTLLLLLSLVIVAADVVGRGNDSAGVTVTNVASYLLHDNSDSRIHRIRI